ncbi:MAG: hypothetical protein PHQ59_01970 [Candidatus Daviesbacteria bacterium]|nr:hypothetical protein [Candidatus Daviesbacteria bacterium]
MKVHTVQHPFMCREGQFEEGKQSLCIGLSIKALGKVDRFCCYLGKNRKVKYEIESAEALRIATEHDSVWTNHQGKKVAIVPMSAFERKEKRERKKKLPVEAKPAVQEQLSII